MPDLPPRTAEATDRPWWAILQAGRGNLHRLAGCFTGPFLSVQEAVRQGEANAHNLSNRAVVAAMFRGAGSDCAPYQAWMVVDPSHTYHRNPASLITGPFVSRESAEAHMRDHVYPRGSVVFCFSGWQSPSWCALTEEVKDA